MNSKVAKLQRAASGFLARQQYAKALDVYKKICSLEKMNPDAWRALGQLAGYLEEYATSENAFHKALLLQPGNLQAIDGLAKALEARGKFNEAIELLLQNVPESRIAEGYQLRLGVLCGKAGNFTEAVKWLERHITNRPADAQAHHCLASALESLDQTDSAATEYLEALKLAPDDANLHNNYGVLLQKLGQWPEAMKHYAESIRLNPQFSTAYYNAATALHELGNHPQAIAYHQAAIKLQPDYKEAHVGLGRVYRSAGETDLAINSYRAALAVDRDYAAAYANLGRALMTNGRYDDAMAAYKNALKLEPGNIVVTCAIAALHERRGNFQEAGKLLAPLLETNPHHLNVATTYGLLSRKIDSRKLAIDNLKGALQEKESHSPTAESNIHYVLGKLYDDIAEYDEAFGHFKTANDLLPFDIDKGEMLESVERLKHFFSKEVFAGYARSGNSSRKPVFIVGMPRSGTTLVEQILASHPQVHGAGELTYISEIARSLKQKLDTRTEYPANIQQLSTNILNELSDQYLELASAQEPGCLRVTDKMPHNFRYLGLIEMLFPHATIVHCTRDPIDTCLSIYVNSFVSSHPYATKLENIAVYYTDYYQAIMEHWSGVVTLPILEISYEALVSNQEAETRRLLAHCGLDWHEDCLRFHESKRDISTNSYDQVRQPIYSSSSGRWRNYAKHIQPLLDHFTANSLPPTP